MESKKNIAFIGARGAGKSKLSRKFSKSVSKTALSTDTLISYEENGRTIAKIVDENGWTYFREKEFEVLKKVSEMKEVVIDCGGGILFEAPDPNDPLKVEPLSTRKMNLLKENAIVVYIKRPLPWLLGKMNHRGDPNRPDLDGSYEGLLNRRLPVYESAADLTIDMSTMDLDEALKILEEKLG